MLSESQIEETFKWLAIPIERASEGSPIFIECPFIERHSKRNGPKDARLYFDDYPHVSCFHESCSEARKELNSTLRILILGSPDFPESAKVTFNRPTPEAVTIAHQVKAERTKIIEKFRKMIRPLGECTISSTELLSRLFKPRDVLWVGREFDSGLPVHANRFRTPEEWIAKPPPPFWCYTTGATFRPGSISRCDANVTERKYLILESDCLDQEDSRAVLAWAEYYLGLKLHAVVFSGGESLHGWFEFPGEHQFTNYRPILIEAGFCAKSMNRSQAVRLGSATRKMGGTGSFMARVTGKGGGKKAGKSVDITKLQKAAFNQFVDRTWWHAKSDTFYYLGAKAKEFRPFKKESLREHLLKEGLFGIKIIPTGDKTRDIVKCCVSKTGASLLK